MNRRVFNKSALATMAASTFSNASQIKNTKVKCKKNIVIICHDYGFVPQTFFSDEMESDCREIFKPLKKEMTVFEQIHQPSIGGGHGGAHAMLTCLRYESKFKYPFCSLDQYIAENTTLDRRHKQIYSSTSDGATVSWNSLYQRTPSIKGSSDLYKKRR